jgi:hypothetical protein
MATPATTTIVAMIVTIEPPPPPALGLAHMGKPRVSGEIEFECNRTAINGIDS